VVSAGASIPAKTGRGNILYFPKPEQLTNATLARWLQVLGGDRSKLFCQMFNFLQIRMLYHKVSAWQSGCHDLMALFYK